MDKLMVGWTIGKINDSSQLIGGSSWNWNVGGKIEGRTVAKKGEKKGLRCTCKQS